MFQTHSYQKVSEVISAILKLWIHANERINNKRDICLMIHLMKLELNSEIKKIHIF